MAKIKQNAYRHICAVVLGSLVLSIGLPANAYTLNSYRWRTDSYAESSTTWTFAENSYFNNARKNTASRVRFVVSNPASGQSGLYDVSSISFSEHDLSDGTLVSGLDDDNSVGPYALPFSFDLYGNSYSQLWVGSNGYINFLGATGTISQQTFPSATAPNSTVAGVMCDLDPRRGGTVKYKSFGSSPNRIFVVEYRNILYYISGGNETFQIKLFEGNNNIEIHTASAAGTRTCTQGVENADGTAADWLTGRNYANWALTNDAIRFTPGGVGGDTVLSSRLEYAAKSGTCAASTGWIQVPATATSGEHWQMSASAYLSDGQATTHNAGVSTPSGKTFTASYAKTDSAQALNVTVGTSLFTEYEFSVAPTADATNGGYYCFRLTDAGETFSSYVQYAEAHVVPAPVAATDSYSTGKNVTLNVAASGVLANDTEYNGDPLTAIKATDPSHGDLTLNSDGSFSYLPDTNYAGSDSFTYYANNGVADSNTVTVSLTVTNAAPVATSDSGYSVTEGATLSVAAPGVLANDTDANSDPLTAVLLTDALRGNLTLNADGSFIYVPLADWGGADTFTYRAYDGTAYSNSVTVSIGVITNDATINNRVVLERLTAGETGTATVTFGTSNALSGTITVTFDVGFVLNSAFTGGSCVGGTVDTFGMSGQTLTAEKHDCQPGTIQLWGASVTNPSSSGLYWIRWVNDDPGGSGIYITDADDVTVFGTVDPFLTFDLDVALTDTESAAPYEVSLGTVSPIDTRVSGTTDSVPYIWFDLETNATSGATVTLKNANGSAGLKSVSVPTDDIGNAATGVSDGTENYGLCVVGTSNAAEGATLSRAAAYASLTCSANTVGNTVAALSSGAPTAVASAVAPIADGRAQLSVQAAISVLTAAHNDYTDTITFVATATF